MGVAFDFSIPTKTLYTTSCITNAQSTSLSSDKAPNIMFLMVIVTRAGFSGYNIGIKNSRTCLVLTSLHLKIAYLSFASMRVENLPSINQSVCDAIPSP